METEEQTQWQQMTREQRQRVIAVLVEMLLRQAMNEAAEVSDERGE